MFFSDTKQIKKLSSLGVLVVVDERDAGHVRAAHLVHERVAQHTPAEQLTERHGQVDLVEAALVEEVGAQVVRRVGERDGEVGGAVEHGDLRLLDCDVKERSARKRFDWLKSFADPACCRKRLSFSCCCYAHLAKFSK